MRVPPGSGLGANALPLSEWEELPRRPTLFHGGRPKGAPPGGMEQSAWPNAGPAHLRLSRNIRRQAIPQLHPLVPPQVLHFMQVPFLTSV